MLKTIIFSFTFWFIFIFAPAFAKDNIVDYNFTIIDADHHLVSIEIRHPALQQDEVIMSLPAWRIGRYEILNLANSISSFSVHDQHNKELSWHKIDKNTWKIINPSHTALIVRYTVYANQLATRSRHIDDSHAFINASGYFLYVQESRHWPISIKLNIPKEWDSVSGLISTKEKHQYMATDYDQFVDSPIEAGIIERHQFNVESTPYELALWGKGNYNSQQMVTDLSKLVKTYKRIWPNKPYSKYVFMVHATTNTRGATEHINSTIIQRKRFSFAPRKQYLEFLATAAHEFIHTWNVKSYRPEAFVPYDYLKESYSPLLWISEGSTRYFQYHLLILAGLMTVEEYFEILADEMLEHHKTPGINKQSIASASFNKWMSTKGHQALNQNVNIYDEGALLSLILDLKLLADSGGAISYRDVHAQLYKRFSSTTAFNTQDVLVILEALTGVDYTLWWQKFVLTPVNLSFKEALYSVGLELDTSIKTQQSGIIINTKSNLVTHVIENSAGWNAGITVNDEIIAMDGLRIHFGQLEERLADYKPEHEIKFTLFRRDELITRQYKVPQATTSRYKIVPVAHSSALQRKLFKAWLGVDYKASLYTNPSSS